MGLEKPRISEAHLVLWLGLRAPGLSLPAYLCAGAEARASRRPLSEPRTGWRTAARRKPPEHGREVRSRWGWGERAAPGTAAGHRCPWPRSAAWRRAGIAAALGPSRATCALAGGPGRTRIEKSIHSGFQTLAGPWRSRREVGGLTHHPSLSLGSLGQRREGSPELGSGPPRGAGLLGPPSFPRPP